MGKPEVLWLYEAMPLFLDSRDSKNKLEVTRIGQVVQNRFQKMKMKKIKTKNKVSKFVKNKK
jgi:hypothetical protein